ncbi:MAG: MFS transporter [Bacteroidota bacterium]
MDQRLKHSPFNLAVFAAGLGFFVDTFDLFLFNIYRIPSLKELGLQGHALSQTGEFLLAVQMAGMMVGGVVSGVFGDKRGRVSVLFGSILLYSLANICNAFVSDPQTYAIVRFLAGVGLAGELGAGITLVSESMTIERRGYGTILVATLGGLGAVCAGLSGEFIHWRTAFFMAGIAGLFLLFLRMKSLEPAMYKRSMTLQNTLNGSFKLLLSNKLRFLKYVACIAMGVPIWYTVGLLITFTPEITSLKGIDGVILGTCFILFQVGVTVGDLSSGVLSQLLKTRKKVILAFMALAIASTILHFFFIEQSGSLYPSSLLMGLGCGYLSVFVTTTAEQFGTNPRVLVTSTVTNFMRGAVTVMIPLRALLGEWLSLDLIGSLMLTGLLVWALAILSALALPDTFGKDLDFHET